MQDRHSQRRIIRGYKKVSAITGKSPVQVWRDVTAGTFPPPIVLGANSVGWYADEIDAYLNSRPRVEYAPKSESSPWLGHNEPPPDGRVDDGPHSSDQKIPGRGSRREQRSEPKTEAPQEAA